ncbi:rhomboid family intramembrane serine protease [Thermoproteota archaeon]
MRTRSSGSFWLQNASMPLIIINIIVFVLQIMFQPWFTESFLLVSSEVLSRPWILLTSMFLHGSSMHLLFNMYALLIFGPLIESRIGSKRFVFIYFLSGIIAALSSVFFYDRVLGASGAIMGIIGVTIMLMPHLRVLLFFVIPMSLRTAGIIFALVDIMGIFTMSGIANIAHLAGLCCGLGFGYYLLKKKRKFSEGFSNTTYRKSSHPKYSKYTNRDRGSKSIEMSKEEIENYLRYGRL